MSMTPITHHIDENIPFESGAVLSRNASNIKNCFWIISIDVKNRRLNFFPDVCAII
jgi:hypothetical protein